MTEVEEKRLIAMIVSEVLERGDKIVKLKNDGFGHMLPDPTTELEVR